MRHPDVIVVGAGLSGLTCARTLSVRGRRVLVVDAGDAVGGRVRTDRVDGFLLDRGFQVFLTAYPEASAVFDVPALKLRPFEPGARIFFNGRFHALTDPWRRPLEALATALGPVGNVADKLRIARLRSHASKGTLDQLFARPQESARERLRRLGFSDLFVQRFLAPFLGGIFLEGELSTSSRMMEFVLRMMAKGDVALPTGGMASLPDQLAAALPMGSVRLSTRVARVQPNFVELDTGERLECAHVVVATEGTQTAKLVPAFAAPQTCGVTCLYFAAPTAPLKGPHLLLNGEGEGPVNNVAVVSEVVPGYAPQGQSLISVSVLGARGEPSLEAEVLSQLTRWFGSQVASWRSLKTYVLEQALPAQPPGVFASGERPVRLPGGIFICGDHREHGSIEGSVRSGRRAAEALLELPRSRVA